MMSRVLSALGIPVACLLAYWIALYVFASGFTRESDTIGAMWAAIGAAVVFRDTRAEAFAAGIGRLRATFVSLALCLIYLWFLPPTAVGMAAVIFAGTLVVRVLGWRQDTITTAVTTIVLIVLAQLDPRNAWYQPLLRFLDTLLGIAVGIACKWLSDVAFARHGGNEE